VLAEEARLSGFEKGRGEGFTKGLESAKQSLAERVLKLDALVAMLESARMSLAKSVEDDMIELVFSSLCRLLADNVISRDAVRAKIQANIERYSSEGIVNVHLAPSDYEWVQMDESLNSLLAKHTQASAIRWLPDRAVAAGGCVIECGSTAIDARLETQLEGIKEELLRVRCETRAV
jgi:flagellar assembly protein FliH